MKPIEERVRRRTVATAAAALAMGVLGIAPPARAATVVCNPTWEKVNGDGYVVAAQDYNLKNGPYGDCGHTGKITKGTVFYLWCMTTNNYGNNWWYGRIAGTQTMGWAYQEPLFGARQDIKNDSDDGVLNVKGCGPRVVWP